MRSDSSPWEPRIIDLETQLVYQQRLCEQLNDVVTAHSRQLLLLQRTVQELNGRLKDLQLQRKEPPLDPAEEKPPHY